MIQTVIQLPLNSSVQIKNFGAKDMYEKLASENLASNSQFIGLTSNTLFTDLKNTLHLVKETTFKIVAEITCDYITIKVPFDQNIKVSGTLTLKANDLLITKMEEKLNKEISSLDEMDILEVFPNLYDVIESEMNYVGEFNNFPLLSLLQVLKELDVSEMFEENIIKLNLNY